MLKDRLLLIDGNSIMNRAFYGIMGNKMLSTNDGKYTNAVYGFLTILFKNIEELNPKYLAVSFDLRRKTKRHEMYEEYKANRHGMPDELAKQMPMIKDILRAMNIDIVEKEGYEGDDILGTLSKYGEKQGLNVTILSGDRDTFQLASDNITIRIPRTKQGKTETVEYDEKKIIEEYGIKPIALIEVKGLQGDTSDNIPGIPGIGPKTAINLIKKYGTIKNLYNKIEEGKDTLKGKQREAIVENKEKAFLSRELGKIDVKVPLDNNLETLKVEEWDKAEVLKLFKEYNFKKFIERFKLEEDDILYNKKDTENLFKINSNITIKELEKRVNKLKKIIYYFGLEENQNQEDIIKKDIVSISIYDYETEEVYYIQKKDEEFDKFIKRIFENEELEKIGYELGNSYIILKQMGITMKNLKYDITVASYILDPTEGKYLIDNIIEKYLELDINKYLENQGIEQTQTKQITLFETNEPQKDTLLHKTAFYAFCIYELLSILTQKLNEIEAIELFENIDMPTVEVLADMQWNGMHVEAKDLIKFGKELKDGIDLLTKEIYKLAKTEFNINSPKQLGEILFEKMKLPVKKKTKNGYSTAEDVLEKLIDESPIIEKILEYRKLCKLNSTYVEGMLVYINQKTNRIHSFFHQTITSTRKNKFNRAKSTKYSNKIRTWKTT